VSLVNSFHNVKIKFAEAEPEKEPSPGEQLAITSIITNAIFPFVALIMAMVAIIKSVRGHTKLVLPIIALCFSAPVVFLLIWFFAGNRDWWYMFLPFVHCLLIFVHLL